MLQRRDLLVLLGFLIGATVGFFAFGGQFTPTQWNNGDTEAAMRAIGTEPLIGFLLGGFGTAWVINRHIEGGRNQQR
jgi:hypothetical protein